MRRLLQQVLLSAAKEMWNADPTLGEYTRETAEHELNLAFHYASTLKRWLPWFDTDFDVTKSNFNNARPDIILHIRGGHGANFLVVEIKRQSNPEGIGEDLEKIRTKWFGGRLNYRFGAGLILDEARRTAEVTILERGSDFQAAATFDNPNQAWTRRPYSDECIGSLGSLLRYLSTIDGDQHRALDGELDRLMADAVYGP
jgi:hypothetical protein